MAAHLSETMYLLKRRTANAQVPEGCTCADDSGSCPWCLVYYEDDDSSSQPATGENK